MISAHRTRLAVSLLCACLWLSSSLISQVAANPEPVRTMSISAHDGQPGYTLGISAQGRHGLVEVHSDSGSLVQTLRCPLLGDSADADDVAIKSVAEEFVSDFQLEDLNFDGYLDLKGDREFGAKWGRYCVWLFDPKNHRFEEDELAEQMELLYNLQADPKRRLIIAYSIGPVNPMWDEYRIENVSKDRPYWPRLIPVQSCLIETGPQGLENEPANATAVLTRYEQGLVVVRRPLHSGDERFQQAGCGERRSTRVRKPAR
jgi:hypothetical protein